MKVFQNLKKNIEIFSGYADQRWNIKTVLSFFLLGTFAIAPVMYFLFEAEDFQEYADSFYLSVTTCVGGVVAPIAVWNIHKFYKFCDNIDAAMQKHEQMDPLSRAIFRKLNEKIEKLTRMIWFAIQFTTYCLMVPQIFVMFYGHFTTGLEADDYQLPLRAWLPFNYSTPLTYPVAYSLQFAQTHWFLNYNGISLVLYTGSCLFLITFTNEAKKWLNNLKETYKTEENRGEMKRKFNDFIRFHVEAKQFVSEFNDYFGYSLFCWFLWGLITVCGTLLMIEVQTSQDSVNWTILLIVGVQLFWTFAIMFVLCYLGEEVNTAFEEMSDEIYQCDWHLFPHELQRILPTVMTVAQHPVYIESFGGIRCTRDTFKRIINTGYSYFQVIRTMN